MMLLPVIPMMTMTAHRGARNQGYSSAKPGARLAMAKSARYPTAERAPHMRRMDAVPAMKRALWALFMVL